MNETEQDPGQNNEQYGLWANLQPLCQQGFSVRTTIIQRSSVCCSSGTELSHSLAVPPGKTVK